jgi:hypothetical protein
MKEVLGKVVKVQVGTSLDLVLVVVLPEGHFLHALVV